MSLFLLCFNYFPNFSFLSMSLTVTFKHKVNFTTGNCTTNLAPRIADPVSTQPGGGLQTGQDLLHYGVSVYSHLAKLYSTDKRFRSSMNQRIIFEPVTCELFYEGKLIGRLNAIEGRILLALVSSSGNIIDRDELLDTAWPNKSVTPNSLNVAVKKIRSIFHNIINDEIIITHFKKGFSWNEKYQIEIFEANPAQGVNDFSSSLHATISVSSEIYSHSSDFPDIKMETSDTTPSIPLNKIRTIPHSRWSNCFYYIFCGVLILIFIIHIIFYVTQLTYVKCQTINNSQFCGYGSFSQAQVPSNLPAGNYIYIASQRNGFKYVEIK